MIRSCLIIEQNQDASEIFTAAFREAGFSVSIASTGAEAADFLRHACPDLVLVDQWTAAHSGSVNVFNILQENRYAQTKTIFVTSAPTGLPGYRGVPALTLVKPLLFADLKKVAQDLYQSLLTTGQKASNIQPASTGVPRDASI